MLVNVFKIKTWQVLTLHAVFSLVGKMACKIVVHWNKSINILLVYEERKSYSLSC